MAPLLLIGIGNEFRRDDGVGLVIVRQLRPRLPPDVRVLELSGEGVSLMQAWQDAAMVGVFDAVRSPSPPGTLYQIDAHAQTVPSQFFHYSTHAFSLAEAVELSRVLDQLPPQIHLYGIAGSDFSYGVGLSDAVAAAVPVVVDRVWQNLSNQLAIHHA
jgi:hydrogenase maturation protease